MGKIKFALTEKCPRCGEGELFTDKSYFPIGKKTYQMKKYCTHCGLKYEKELGYFYGSMYVSYALNIALFVTTLVIYILFFKHSYGWAHFGVAYVLLSFLLNGVMFRFARSLWVNALTKYEPEVKDFKNLELLKTEVNIGK
jgi:uncharacterized protein (DUF983 family)